MNENTKNVNVLDEQETLKKLATGKFSFIRYGDGEFELAFNTGFTYFKNLLLRREIKVFDNGGFLLNHRMKDAIKSESENLLIGIPNVFKADSSKMWKSKYFYNNSDRIKSLLSDDSDIEYGSAFCFRYNKRYEMSEKEYWRDILNIWSGRDICLVNFNPDVCKHEVFSSAKTVEFIECERRDAFGVTGAKYKKLLKECLNSKAEMILASVGPVSNILAHDLSVKGKICIDIGQLAGKYNLIKGLDFDELY